MTLSLDIPIPCQTDLQNFTIDEPIVRREFDETIPLNLSRYILSSFSMLKDDDPLDIKFAELVGSFFDDQLNSVEGLDSSMMVHLCRCEERRPDGERNLVFVITMEPEYIRKGLWKVVWWKTEAWLQEHFTEWDLVLRIYWTGPIGPG